MMKSSDVGALLVLAGCAEVENYNDGENARAGRSGRVPAVKGSQRKLCSPEASPARVVTKRRRYAGLPPVHKARYCLPGKLTMLR